MVEKWWKKSGKRLVGNKKTQKQNSWKAQGISVSEESLEKPFEREVLMLTKKSTSEWQRSEEPSELEFMSLEFGLGAIFWEFSLLHFCVFFVCFFGLWKEKHDEFMMLSFTRRPLLKGMMFQRSIFFGHKGSIRQSTGERGCGNH